MRDTSDSRGAPAKRARTTGTYTKSAPRVAARSRFTAGSGPELKFFDTALSFTADATGEVPATGQLNFIRQGAGESQRVGRKVIVKSVQIQAGLAYAPGAGAAAATILYVFLVQDTQANGAAAAVTDVLTSTALATALPNVENNQRFRILRKFVWEMNSPSGVTTAYNDMRLDWKYYGKCSIPIDFSADVGDITDVRSNNLFLIAGSNGSDDLVSVAGTCRLRFSD